MDADLQDSPDEIPELYRMIYGRMDMTWFQDGNRNDMTRCQKQFLQNCLMLLHEKSQV